MARKKISLNDLVTLIAGVDYIDIDLNTCYSPIVFSSKGVRYVVGMDPNDENVFLLKLKDKVPLSVVMNKEFRFLLHIDSEHCWTILDVHNCDSLGSDEAEKMLREKCGLDENHAIYFMSRYSFKPNRFYPYSNDEEEEFWKNVIDLRSDELGEEKIYIWQKKNNIKMKEKLPIVGKKYHFFDDGKCGPSRHYIAEVKEVITVKEAKTREVPCVVDDDGKESDFRPLIKIWRNEVKGHDFLFPNKTDYFVRCSVPKYDKNDLWFVRTRDGGWFSLDIQSFWQGGRLDVSGEIYQEIKELFDSDHYDGYYDELSETEIID